ncbi:MAG: RHS repeat-associated core domain-containing protein [Planctomycetota bacterium]
MAVAPSTAPIRYTLQDFDTSIYEVSVTGAPTGRVLDLGVEIGAMAWDGVHLWCGSYDGAGTIYGVDVASGTVFRSFAVPSGPKDYSPGNISGLAYDALHQSLWYGMAGGRRVFQIDLSGSPISHFDVSFQGFTGVAYDAATDTLWLADFMLSMQRQFDRSGSALASFSMGAYVPEAGSVDAVTFPGTIALWTNEATTDGNRLRATEIGSRSTTPAYEPGPSSTPPGATLAEGNGTPTDDRGAASSIYLFSGEFHQSVMDLRIRGRGLDFVWARKYRSKHGPKTALGNNWDFSYNIYVEASAQDLILHDGNSRSDVYPLQANGKWARNEFFRELARNADQSYTLSFPDGGKWNFLPLSHALAPGRVSSIVDRNGNAVTCLYDAAGRLATVRDALGRAIAIGYDANGLIASVTDFIGRQVVYGHDQDGDLVSVRSPVVSGTPNGNDFPSGKVTRYTYSKGFADARLNGNLLTITDPRGQTYLRNTYAATTEPMDLDFDRVIEQASGLASDLIEIVYVPQAGAAVIKAIVNNRRGHVSEFSYDSANRLVMARQFTGHAVPGQPTTDTDNRPQDRLRADDPAYFETTWQYNADALPTLIVQPNLNTIASTYELDLDADAARLARGNLRMVVRNAGPLGGDQASITASFSYRPGTSFLLTQADGRGNVTTHAYDERGNRTQTSERLAGVVDSWEYNAFGQVAAHTRPANGSGWRRRDEYTYHATGPQAGYLQSEIVDKLGFASTISYEEDAVGNVTRKIDGRGLDTLYQYNALDQLVQELSRPINGVRYELLMWYDANDNVVRTDVDNRDENGVQQPNTHFSTIRDYEILNRVVCVGEEKGDARLTNADLTCASFPPGTAALTGYAYDSNRNQTAVLSPEAMNGNRPANRTDTQYDERDLVFRTVRAQGDPLQSTSQVDYDGNGNVRVLRAGLEGDVHVTVNAYDGYDRLVASTDPMGNVTRRHYDANGNRIAERMDGELVDQPGGAANVRLAETAFTYDAMDRLTRTDVAFFNSQSQAPLFDGLATTSTTYADNSQVIRVADDNDHATTTTYDSASRVQTVTDAMGNSVTNAYDVNSNVIRVTSVELSDLGKPSQSFTTTNTYDTLDRLVQTVDSVGNSTTFRYDSRSNRTSGKDALASERRASYDGLDRRNATVVDIDGDGADGELPGDPDIRLERGWDDNSNARVSKDDNVHATVEEYDARNQSRGLAWADGGMTECRYDVHGNLIFERDANGTETTCRYDLLNRLIERDFSPGPGVSAATTFEYFDYDGLSRIVRAQNDVALVVRWYDSLSHVIGETLNGKTTQCTFDGAGNRIRLVYPSGRTVSRFNDALNRATSIIDGRGQIALYDYLGPGRVERLTYGNGVACDYAYDGIAPNPPGDFGVKRIVRTTHKKNGTIVDDRTYLWDRVGNKTRRKDERAGGPGFRADYQYDRAYRLTDAMVRTASGPCARHTHYDLDGAGNRTRVWGPRWDWGWYREVGLDASVNEYSKSPFARYTYDGNGNLKRAAPAGGNTKSLGTILYDALNRMVEFPDVPFFGTRCVYKYDPFGRRIEKARLGPGAPAVTSYYFEGLQEIEEQDANGGLLASYAFGDYIDEVLNMRRGGIDLYYHADDLYNVVALTDANGAVVERYEYDDYGRPLHPVTLEPLAQPSSLGNELLFNGRRYDLESGWYYYRSRYMDPRAGRFTTRDAIGIWGDESNLGNGYAYAANSPLCHLDPTGHYLVAPEEIVRDDFLKKLKALGLEAEALPLQEVDLGLKIGNEAIKHTYYLIQAKKGQEDKLKELAEKNPDESLLKALADEGKVYTGGVGAKGCGIVLKGKLTAESAFRIYGVQSGMSVAEVDWAMDLAKTLRSQIEPPKKGEEHDKCAEWVTTFRGKWEKKFKDKFAKPETKFWDVGYTEAQEKFVEDMKDKLKEGSDFWFLVGNPQHTTLLMTFGNGKQVILDCGFIARFEKVFDKDSKTIPFFALPGDMPKAWKPWKPK